MLATYCVLLGAFAALMSDVLVAGAFLSGMRPRLGLAPPSQDEFYKIPKDINNHAPGTVLRTRNVPELAFGHLAGTAEQLFYKTTGPDNDSDGTVTTFVTPRHPRKGPPKLIAVAAAIDASSIDCAPSYALATPGTSRNNVLIRLLSDPFISASLFRGYYVTIPDYLGSKSAFLSSHTEGKAMLDGIRAATNYKKELQNADVAILGYSGGAHGTAAAGHAWPQYAPDVRLKGIALGGLPVDIRATLNKVNGGTFSGLSFTGAVGLAAAHPELHKYFNAELNEAGRRNFTKIQNGQWCVPQVVIQLLRVNISSAFKDPRALEAPQIQKVYEIEKIGHGYPPLKAPAYIFHSTTDDIVPFEQASKYVNSQCKQGAMIHFSTTSGIDHIAAALRSMPLIFGQVKRFLEDNLDATQMQGGCTFDKIAGNSLKAEAHIDLMGTQAVHQMKEFASKLEQLH